MKMKKLLVCCLAAMIAISITACGKGESPPKQTSHSSQPASSLAQTIPAETNTLKTDGIPSGAFLLKMELGHIFYAEETMDKAEIGIANPLTGEIKTISVPNVEENAIVDYAVTEDETVWVLSVPVKDGNRTTVYQFDLEGNEQSSFEVDGLPRAMAVDETGTVYLAYENAMKNEPNKILVLSSEGEEKASLDVGFYPMFLNANDDSVHVISMENEVTSIEKLNADGTYSPSQFQNVINDIGFCDLIDGGGEYGFFMFGETEILGYNSNTNELTPLISSDQLGEGEDPFYTVFSLEQGRLCLVLSNDDYTKLNFEILNINR